MRPQTCLLGVLVAAAAGVTVAATAVSGDAREPPPARHMVRSESARVGLGRRLFHDPAASLDGRHACASCHDPELGWSDPRRVSDDADGPTRRHSQTIADLRGPGFHWDGEFATPRELIAARLGETSPGGPPGRYAGLTSPSVSASAPLPIADRLSADGWYDRAFAAAFGTPEVTTTRVVDALDEFVASVRSARNPVDRYLAGARDALSDEARRGLELFRGRAGCATCHSLQRGTDGRAALTDDRFHNTGVAFRGAPDGREPEVVEVNLNGRTIHVDVGQPERGRAGVTQDDGDVGAFKTPSLRDVARRGPYMHDGSFATLEEVVRYYSAGGTPNEGLDRSVRRLDLAEGEVADLVEFLESLSGETRPGLLAPRVVRKRVKLRVVDPWGDPVGGLRFDVLPAGERRGDGDLPASLGGVTSARGEASIEFPQWTHVRLRSATHEMAFDRPLPDCVGDLSVLAAPKDRIWVLLRRSAAPATEPPARLVGRLASVQSPKLPRRSGCEVLFPTPQGFTRFHVLTQPEPSPASDAETFAFERVRTISTTDAIYSAPLGTARSRSVLRFRLDRETEVAAPVDLDGGWSEPALLRPVVTVTVPLR